ncbi:hypothetical protein CTA1_2759 [Colletotrichum tanaceti]|uniref:Uncharacterized protein n=1 Tax=Colletotrichum tanaceti TaxID=1306861 RepID=A0A4U6X7G5_9PEZI|nr:hypothetical protein CTA1_2759 [Colletotrichum tanaceti]
MYVGREVYSRSVVSRVGVAGHELADGDDFASVEGEAGLQRTGKEIPDGALGRRQGRGQRRLGAAQVQGAVVVDVVQGLHGVVVVRLLGAAAEVAARRRVARVLLVVVVALKGLDGDAVLLGDAADVGDDVVLDLGDAVLRGDAVVDADADLLGHGVDLLAGLEVVDALGGRQAVVGGAVDGDELGGEGVEVAALEQLGHARLGAGRVAGLADHVLVQRGGGGELGVVGAGLEGDDHLGDDADAGVGEGDGRVAAGDVQVEPDVDVALFGDGGQGVEGAGAAAVVVLVLEELQAHAALVEDEGHAVVAPEALEVDGDVAGAAGAGALLVEAGGEDDGAGRGPLTAVAAAGGGGGGGGGGGSSPRGGSRLLGEEGLEGGEEGGEGVLVVRDAAAPHPLAVEVGGEGRVGPGGGVGDGDDVLVGGEQDGFQGGVGAAEGVDEAKGVYLDELCAGVAGVKVVSVEWYKEEDEEDVVQVVKDAPAVILVKVAEVVVADGGHADEGGVALDLLADGVRGGEEVGGGGEAVGGGHGGREVTFEVGGSGGIDDGALLTMLLLLLLGISVEGRGGGCEG